MLRWDKLPPQMQTEAVKPYYEILQHKKGSLILKRFFDIVASLILIVLLSPVMLVLAIWIKCDSPGPIFFRQERVTRYGKIFRIFKFRTMVTGADRMGSLVTTKGDTRVTKVGAKIRHGRLDEIPQLFNILLGDMSFVGTRPEVKKYVDAYTDEMWATLLLPAGVTSEASIEYKDEDQLLEQAENADEVYINTILPEKMKWNLKYLQAYGIWADIKVIFKTVDDILD